MSKPPTYKAIFKTEPVYLTNLLIGSGVACPTSLYEKVRMSCPTGEQAQLDRQIVQWLHENPELGAFYINRYPNQQENHDELVVVFSDANAALMLKLALTR